MIANFCFTFHCSSSVRKQQEYKNKYIGSNCPIFVTLILIRANLAKIF